MYSIRVYTVLHFLQLPPRFCISFFKNPFRTPPKWPWPLFIGERSNRYSYSTNLSFPTSFSFLSLLKRLLKQQQQNVDFLIFPDVSSSHVTVLSNEINAEISWCLFFPFFHIPFWNSNTMAGNMAATWQPRGNLHEDEGQHADSREKR